MSESHQRSANYSNTEASRKADGRRLPVGADLLTAGGVHFRVWAPHSTKLEVVIQSGRGSSTEMSKDGSGYWSAIVAEAGPGDLYRFRIDGADSPVPDPASRFQPEGPFGPSMIVD